MPEPSKDLSDQLDDLNTARMTIREAAASLRSVITSHEAKIATLKDLLLDTERAPLTDAEIEARVDKTITELKWRHKGTLPGYPLIEHGEELPDGGYGAKSRPEAMAARTFFDYAKLQYLFLEMLGPQLRAMLIANAKVEAGKRGVPAMTAAARTARIAELEPQIAQLEAELAELQKEAAAFNLMAAR